METGTEMRIKEINKMKDKLEKDINMRRNTNKRYKRFYNGLQMLTIGSSSIATSLAAATVGTMANPALVLPLSVTNISLGAVAVVTGILSKTVHKRIKKHQMLCMLTRNTLNTINELLSNNLTDGIISDQEFQQVSKVYQEYLWESQSIKANFSRVNSIKD